MDQLSQAIKELVASSTMASTFHFEIEDEIFRGEEAQEMFSEALLSMVSDYMRSRGAS